MGKLTSGGDPAQKIKDMITKDEIKNFGEANNWRGCIGLYFTKKKVNSLKKLGISEGTPIKEAYKLIN